MNVQKRTLKISSRKILLTGNQGLQVRKFRTEKAARKDLDDNQEIFAVGVYQSDKDETTYYEPYQA